MDEIGRGTATTDGLSIGWSCLKYLYQVNQSRTLFATHYHEVFFKFIYLFIYLFIVINDL